jgi:hypothetical protein
MVVVVSSGVTLTVEPGVEVRFPQGAFLQVEGSLAALGTVTQPITFTATNPQPGWWLGVRVEGVPQALAYATLDYVTVEYGGTNAPQAANLYLTYARVTARHSLFRNGGQHGIYGWLKGSASILDSHFLNNPGYAVYLTDVTTDPLLQKLTATGNGTDAVAIGYSGFLTGTHHWEAMGLPYYVVGGQIVAANGMLTVDPGVELRFASNQYLEAEGTLVAVGTVTQPITFTGMTQQPGWWQGLRMWGHPSRPARAMLDHITVEYGGSGVSGANVSVDFGQVSIAHSLIRHGGNDGVRVSNGTGASVIETSQIVDNAGYGVRNLDVHPSHVVLAANNWWGSASGPLADTTCNPGGTGGRVSARVAFRPYLTSPNAVPGYTVPAQAPILSITPQRWFVPADGVSRVWVTLTLRDGTGQPLPGRTTRLTSSRGSAVDGGITNAQGEALAYVTSAVAGDAELVGLIDLESACEFVRAPAATITFTPVDQADALMSGGEAPYLNGRIEIDPQPITRGVSTTLRARVTNPFTLPIAVDGEFGIAQAGVGLAFGPLGTVPSQIIPANGEGVFTVRWTPPIAGHYCVQFIYSWQFVGSANPAAVSSGGGSSQRNLNTYPGPSGSPAGKASLATADKAFKAVSKLPGGHPIPKSLLGRWWNSVKKTASEISKSLGGDPPRLDYQTIALPQKRSLPAIQPGDGISPARAAAMNALYDALLEFLAFGEAATLSLDRYAGASEAGDLTWASQQAAAQLYYQSKMGVAAKSAADRIDALLQVANSEGVQQALVTADDIRAYQQQLLTQGFTAQEIEDARLVGLTDEQIEALRQEIIAADPLTSAGDVLVFLADEAAALRTLGDLMINPPNFSQSVAGHGSRLPVSGAASPIAADNLVRVFESTSTIQVRNPLTQTAAIDLRLRRIDVPADWALEVVPTTVSLAPGQQTTVTVRIQAGTSAVQATRPRVAVEGYAGGQMIGGVTIDMLLPRYTGFDGTLRTFLPVMLR